ncbi:GDP-mannose 3 [Forsythia ovata]|uniref:GDP-mannose 3 n=1 Tax=Forsythia ovata TaxID=205694 RepID=A0ABD1XB03_9LAMI
MALTKSDFREPVNIGSDEMVSMNEMAEIVMSFEDKKLPIHHIPGPEGDAYSLNAFGSRKRILEEATEFLATVNHIGQPLLQHGYINASSDLPWATTLPKKNPEQRPNTHKIRATHRSLKFQQNEL